MRRGCGQCSELEPPGHVNVTDLELETDDRVVPRCVRGGGEGMRAQLEGRYDGQDAQGRGKPAAAAAGRSEMGG
jgi:hypothetical protein